MVEALDAVYSQAYGWMNGLLLQLAVPAKICLVYLALELALPRSRNSLGSYLRAAAFFASSIAINLVPLHFVPALLGVDRRHPLAMLDLRPLTEAASLPVRVAGWFVAAYAGVFLGQFFYYWFHRAQHAVPLLWRFHKVHHSIREMSAASSYHHVTEDLQQYVFTVLPMSFLLGIEQGPVPWLVLMVIGTQSYYIHSSTRLAIGPLRYVIGDNTFHRVHHSMESRHFDKNFGTTTPLWDVLFGTAHFPTPGEWPAVGLADTPPPATVVDYLAMPFRGQSGRPAPAKA